MFYDFTIYKVVKTTVINEIGQTKETYKKDKAFIGDIQPIDEHTRVKTWGSDTIGTFTLYSNESLMCGDMVYYNKPYEVEKVIDWIEYKMYSLKESKVFVSG